MPFNSSPGESQSTVNRFREVELPRKFFNPIVINLRFGPRKPPSIA